MPKQGGGRIGTQGGVSPVSPANGNQGGTHHVPMSQPIRDTPSGHMSGTHLGTHLAVPDLLALAGAKVTPLPLPRGGGENFVSVLERSGGSASIEALPIPAPPGGEPAEKGEGHDAACLGGCSGTGSVNGKPCDWDNFLEDRNRRQGEGEPVIHTEDVKKPEPVAHTEGVKKWDDDTRCWVDCELDDCGNHVGLGNVRLGVRHGGAFVIDGVNGICMPSMCDDEGNEVTH